jgi:Holliday junction resolvase
MKMETNKTFIYRYAHQNEKVPKGWTCKPMDGWHGANGYVIWSKEMTNGRQKGANFERECARMVFERTGIEVKRDLEQYRASDHGDLIGLPGWTVECKRYARGTTWRKEWWQQVVAASNAAGTEPVLIYKFDRCPIRCVVRLSSISPVYLEKDNVAEVDFDTWCMLFAESMCDV